MSYKMTLGEHIMEVISHGYEIEFSQSQEYMEISLTKPRRGRSLFRVSIQAFLGHKIPDEIVILAIKQALRNAQHDPHNEYRHFSKFTPDESPSAEDISRKHAADVLKRAAVLGVLKNPIAAVMGAKASIENPGNPIMGPIWKGSGPAIEDKTGGKS